MTDINLTPIEPGDVADASVLMDNLYTLRDAISASEQSVNNKESASNKNLPGGYCGLDGNGNIPSEILTKITTSIVNAIYPVGSIYISIESSCPIANLIPDSTWTLVGAGRALWTGNGQTSADGVTTKNSSYANAKANTIIAEGLPNITGAFYSERNECSGVFYNNNETRTGGGTNSNGAISERIHFDASTQKTIYGQSSTVQPRAYVVNVWKRTA